ncbi:MAG: hypothetical protein HY661_07515 [Betaproteobacteria bacterium]|nr:hypothetical protein [Betaproteobacteria bacterium]
MFIGAVPKEVVGQVLATVPFDAWGNVYVGCSGSFRFDRAVKMRHPECRVYSNDVSLLTCSIGALAMGREFPVKFKGALAFVEPAIDGLDFRGRVAAVMVAAAMGNFTGKNEYAQVHFRHYREHFRTFVDQALPKLDALVAEIKIEEFYAGDFLEQADRAENSGGGMACFAPTYKGGYERIYKLVNENVEWPAPKYGIWNPDSLPALIVSLEERHIPYCVISDQLLADRTPTTEWRGSNKPVYTYSSNQAASLRRRLPNEVPFKYTPVEPAAITAESKVSMCVVDSKRMTYLKNVYLTKGIEHTTGQINCLVLIDGALAGGFIFAQTRFGDKTRELYMLSDFAIARERRLSKLIPMIATCREVIQPINRRLLIKVEYIVTTAFTTKPVSMKYRGIFELDKRTADHLQYQSAVRNQSIQDVFHEWLRKYAGQGGKPDRQGQAARAEAAGEECALHDAAGV